MKINFMKVNSMEKKLTKKARDTGILYASLWFFQKVLVMQLSLS
jgi:hypothetical protein